MNANITWTRNIGSLDTGEVVASVARLESGDWLATRWRGSMTRTHAGFSTREAAIAWDPDISPITVAAYRGEDGPGYYASGTRAYAYRGPAWIVIQCSDPDMRLSLAAAARGRLESEAEQRW